MKLLEGNSVSNAFSLNYKVGKGFAIFVLQIVPLERIAKNMNAEI